MKRFIKFTYNICLRFSTVLLINWVVLFNQSPHTYIYILTHTRSHTLLKEFKFVYIGIIDIYTFLYTTKIFICV